MIKREDNPFEDPAIAREWINSIENEKGQIRERELMPLIRSWVTEKQVRTLVDIGMGQGGCAPAVQYEPSVRYIGIEPSTVLVARAKELFSAPNREFLVGNAYQISLPDHCTDAALSVNVWFHLKDLVTAAQEMARILKPGGVFMICTANPVAHENWRTRFDPDAHETDEYIDGRVYIPINPLSRNLFFKHSLASSKAALESNGLSIDSIVENGLFDRRNGPEQALFINIFGHKK
ncbi:MAG TPA: class I SAM-dependent methyltransferase [Candidatus Paceibacterota bacterium]